MRVFLRVAVFSLAIALTTTPSRAQPVLEAAYVLLGGNGAVARTIHTGTADCPSLSINGTTQPMSVRMAPQTGKDAPFPVLVCELAIPAAANSVTLNGTPLPLPPAGTLATVAVIGDTGCRLKAEKGTTPKDKDYEADGKFQDCESDWPFSQLAASTAAEKPQLLVHVGDYIYRESKCPHHDKGCKGSPHGDTWLTWQADFFAPAKPLLAAAPWLATRGNHETCSRNGAGFMLFLDPTLAVNQQPAPCGALIDTFSVTVGGQQFVMLDTSNAPDECVSGKKAAKGKKKKKKEVACDLTKNLAPNCPKSGCSAKDYADQFAAMKPANGAWLVTHRPAWGFKNKGKPLNATLQAALTAWSGQLPPGFALAAAGHIHIWEALSFKDKGAPQFVLGNGGTLLTGKIDRKLKGLKVGGREVRDAKTSHKWGFTIFTPATGGWTLTAYSVKGKDKFECSLAQGTVSCP